MPFVVLYDANVLYPNLLRNLLVRLAIKDLVQAKWSDDILDETFRSILAGRPSLDPERLARTRALMNDALPDACVTGYKPLIEALSLPDPDDRHVLAAAIKGKAEVIVTCDKGFPPDVLAEWDIEAKHPDDFVLDQVHLRAPAVVSCIQEISAESRHPRQTPADVVEALEEHHQMVKTAALLLPILA